VYHVGLQVDISSYRLSNVQSRVGFPRGSANVQNIDFDLLCSASYLLGVDSHLKDWNIIYTCASARLNNALHDPMRFAQTAPAWTPGFLDRDTRDTPGALQTHPTLSGLLFFACHQLQPIARDLFLSCSM